MRASKIMSETKDLTVSFDSGDLHVTYYPNAYTPAKADAVQEAMQDPKRQTDGMITMVQEMIASWDLEDEHDQTIPLDDGERLRNEVGTGIIGEIFKGIGEQANAGKAPARS